MADCEAGPGEDCTYKWSKEKTTVFIRLRGENDHLFTGAKYSAAIAWRTILGKMGLQGKISPIQAKKKWDNLKKKYKDCKYPASGEGVCGKPSAATWPWFDLMDEVLGQRPSTTPPVLFAPISEDTPGPSTTVDKREETDEEESESGRSQPPAGRKRIAEELLDLLREDFRLQREAEERRAQERKEMFDRLFNLLEKIVTK
ncbi:uncharacterized protein LOC112138669 isoform X2 [Oryzias melastigma]|uniref:Uncharacterized LOC112138669 n=1 Tax=Oryzias melastigma TaxID=30732 RepID=A0A3B3CDP7_ORYME|nr:uncharacterized protein LOC112138669 isoform X2 [Oryzias melastigma]